jgi:hypothetical protein
MMSNMGLPMSFGSQQETIRQKKKSAAERKGYSAPARAASVPNVTADTNGAPSTSAFVPTPDPWSDDS